MYSLACVATQLLTKVIIFQRCRNDNDPNFHLAYLYVSMHLAREPLPECQRVSWQGQHFATPQQQRRWLVLNEEVDALRSLGLEGTKEEFKRLFRPLMRKRIEKRLDQQPTYFPGCEPPEEEEHEVEAAKTTAELTYIENLLFPKHPSFESLFAHYSREIEALSPETKLQLESLKQLLRASFKLISSQRPTPREGLTMLQRLSPK